LTAAAGATTITVGATAQMAVDQLVMIEPGTTNAEPAIVTAVNSGTTVTLQGFGGASNNTFAKTHTQPFTVSAKVVRQVAVLGDPQNHAQLANVNTSGSLQTTINKICATETTTQLAANATYTGPWIDTSLDGTIYVTATAYVQSSGSAANGWKLQVCDDTANANTLVTIYTASVFTGAMQVISAPIYARYYRFTYTNSATATTTLLEISRVGYTTPPYTLSSAAGASSYTNPPILSVQGATNGTQLTVNVNNALTKGFQGATGLMTQNMKDSGRTRLTLHALNVTGIVSETMFTTLNQNKAGTATTGVSTYTVTAAKTLRLQNITLSLSGTTAGTCSIRMRQTNATGALEQGWFLNYVSTTAFPDRIQYDFPDGYEFAAGTVLCFTMQCSVTTVSPSITVTGFEY
jgi:hypothetical protein